jgi:ATP-dependent 26S proteasome regulatory subunit
MTFWWNFSIESFSFLVVSSIVVVFTATLFTRHRATTTPSSDSSFPFPSSPTSHSSYHHPSAQSSQNIHKRRKMADAAKSRDSDQHRDDVDASKAKLTERDRFLEYASVAKEYFRRGLDHLEHECRGLARKNLRKGVEVVEESMGVRLTKAEGKSVEKERGEIVRLKQDALAVMEKEGLNGVSSKGAPTGSHPPAAARGGGGRHLAHNPSKGGMKKPIGKKEESSSMKSDEVRSSVRWEDIAGLEGAKQALYEAAILPTKRPDLFTGLRAPPRGILLFGPPGTGKSMLAKAMSAEADLSFRSFSASSIVSKFVGDSEKNVREMFDDARSNLPCVLFIDEIDSMLTSRTGSEHDASRRLKTEFLVQMDGLSSGSDDRVLLIGATNRPWELDDAALRRFGKRIWIPLPDFPARVSLVQNLLSKNKNTLKEKEIASISRWTEGFSGSDVHALCQEAAMIPLREIQRGKMETIDLEHIRPISMKDFKAAMDVVKPTASKELIKEVENWARDFGMSGV